MATVPTHCPDGHALTYPDVAITYQGCACPAGQPGHYAWECLRCYRDTGRRTLVPPPEHDPAYAMYPWGASF